MDIFFFKIDYQKRLFLLKFLIKILAIEFNDKWNNFHFRNYIDLFNFQITYIQIVQKNSKKILFFFQH